MGLDDLIPDDVDESSSRVPREDDNSDDDNIVKRVGKPPKRKEFTEEQWEKVQRVVRDEFGMTIGEVLSSPNDERYELLHEAVQFTESDKDKGESEHSSKTRCYYCGKACDGAYVELASKKFCVHHTVAQAESKLKND